MLSDFRLFKEGAFVRMIPFLTLESADSGIPLERCFQSVEHSHAFIPKLLGQNFLQLFVKETISQVQMSTTAMNYVLITGFHQRMIFSVKNINNLCGELDTENVLFK